jgi:DNA-binding XRE family transcriptional regulator
MIEPSTINPLALPAVPLEKKSQLPTTPCVYFAIDSQGIVQYIGMTEDLKQRWVSYHRYEYLKLCNQVKISYLQIDNIALLPEIEAALIRYFNPPINRMGSNWIYSVAKPAGLKVRRIIKLEVDVPGLGDRIKQAREGRGWPVTQMAKEVGISRNYWYQL